MNLRALKQAKQSKQNPNCLEAKLKKLNDQLEYINDKAILGDLDALRTHSILMQKIEVTQNRFNGDFGKDQNCMAMYPTSIYANVR